MIRYTKLDRLVSIIPDTSDFIINLGYKGVTPKLLVFLLLYVASVVAEYALPKKNIAFLGTYYVFSNRAILKINFV